MVYFPSLETPSTDLQRIFFYAQTSCLQYAWWKYTNNRNYPSWTSKVDIVNQTIAADYSKQQNHLTSILAEIDAKYTSLVDKLLVLPVDDGIYVRLMETVGTDEQTKEIISTFAVNGMQNVKGESHDENLIFLLGTGSKAIHAGEDDVVIFIGKPAQLDGIVEYAQGGNDTLGTVDSRPELNGNHRKWLMKIAY